MTTFNKGDRVRLSSQASAARRTAVGDSEGTVLDPDALDGFIGVHVRWDRDGLNMFNSPPPREIELVTPTRADDLRDKHAALLAEIDVLQKKADTLAAAIEILEASK